MLARTLLRGSLAQAFMGKSDVIMGTRPTPVPYLMARTRRSVHGPILYGTRWPELCNEVPWRHRPPWPTLNTAVRLQGVGQILGGRLTYRNILRLPELC